MFCTSCGKQVREGAQFCPSCGRAAGGGEAARAASPAGAVIGQRRKSKISVAPILLSLLLTAFAISQMALGFIGASAMGIVTDIQPRVHVGPGKDEGNTREPMRYEMFYEFTAADDKAYSGSVTKSFPNGVRAAADGTPEILAVRYLSFIPHINAPDGETNILPVILLLGLAVLLFLLGIKGSISIGNAKRR
ncbi:hypothetical protein SDC9_86817 [bioreactor metagenome]|uniref:Zinc-ribbon domain-containing protein n=1 Tax=bioreactor metagenome TaxID=1076179 RepID=A0A644ZHH3_9ZZZZ